MDNLDDINAELDLPDVQKLAPKPKRRWEDIVEDVRKKNKLKQKEPEKSRTLEHSLETCGSCEECIATRIQRSPMLKGFYKSRMNVRRSIDNEPA